MTTIIKIAMLRLWNNKTELLLIFVVPIVFFSIFAMIFTRGIGGERAAPIVTVVDDDQSPFSERLREILASTDGIAMHDKVYRTDPDWSLDRIGRHALEVHKVDAIVYLPENTGVKIANRETPELTISTEGSDPFTAQTTRASLLQAVGTAMRPTAIGAADPVSEQSAIVEIATNDVYSVGKQNPKIAMYAAGIAVMFLLFSATGAGGSLLDEAEAGTLDRLLCSRLTLSQLLLGKWTFITLLGCLQITVMFVFAQVVYGVDLLGHLPGFALMTLCTAGATASFALCLASFCKSRSQLNAIAVVLVLAMSALGGSMIPRYIMSDSMKLWGKWTFNAWALDGYQKVFWYDMPLASITNEAAVLAGMAICLGFAARILMQRWNVR